MWLFHLPSRAQEKFQCLHKNSHLFLCINQFCKCIIIYTPEKSSLKQKSEMRPHRRASQTYFIKYQLARNPLKAEEEDLKLALLASLQQCQEQNLKPTSPDDNSSSSSSSSSTPLTDQATAVDSGSDTPDTIICKPATPDNVLKQYRPETEDFLTFICFRSTAPNYQNVSKLGAKNILPTEDANSINTAKNETNYNSNSTRQQLTAGTNSTPDGYSPKLISCDTSANNLKHSSNRLSASLISSSSPKSNDSHRNQSPSNYRRPTRQSPRLASFINRKISKNDSSNHTSSASYTAHELPINYEEDLKRASIALEDMAHEINSSDGTSCINKTSSSFNDDDNNNFAQNSPDCISKLSSSSYKNNRHLVKGLMTREFAGAFADEETIFESISNHKL